MRNIVLIFAIFSQLVFAQQPISIPNADGVYADFTSGEMVKIKGSDVTYHAKNGAWTAMKSKFIANPDDFYFIDAWFPSKPNVIYTFRFDPSKAGGFTCINPDKSEQKYSQFQTFTDYSSVQELVINEMISIYKDDKTGERIEFRAKTENSAFGIYYQAKENAQVLELKVVEQKNSSWTVVFPNKTEKYILTIYSDKILAPSVQCKNPNGSIQYFSFDGLGHL